MKREEANMEIKTKEKHNNSGTIPAVFIIFIPIPISRSTVRRDESYIPLLRYTLFLLFSCLFSFLQKKLCLTETTIVTSARVRTASVLLSKWNEGRERKKISKLIRHKDKRDTKAHWPTAQLGNESH